MFAGEVLQPHCLLPTVSTLDMHLARTAPIISKTVNCHTFISALDTSTMPANVSGPSSQGRLLCQPAIRP